MPTRYIVHGTDAKGQAVQKIIEAGTAAEAEQIARGQDVAAPQVVVGIGGFKAIEVRPAHGDEEEAAGLCGDVPLNESVVEHGELRGGRGELIEQLLQRRKAVHIPGGRMAMRNNPPLILFYIHRDNQLHDRRLLATRSYDRPSFYLSNILAACFPLSSSLRATARTDRL